MNVHSLRQGLILLLPVFTACISLDAPAGKRCDETHPCQAPRTCGLEGFCGVFPLVEEPPPSDGGTDGGEPEPEPEPAVWSRVFIEDFEAIQKDTEFSSSFGRWQVLPPPSGSVLVKDLGGTYKQVLSCTATDSSTPLSVSVNVDPVQRFRLHMPVQITSIYSPSFVTLLTARSTSNATDGYVVELRGNSWKLGYQQTTLQNLAQGTWTLGTNQLVVIGLEVTPTTVTLKNGATVLASVPTTGLPAPRLEGFSMTLTGSLLNVRLLEFFVEAPTN